MADDEQILAGMKVIDCGTYIAAPGCATVMADFGAAVIKIEQPVGGDPYRRLHLSPGMPVSERSYCWMHLGRNKRSLALNLARPAGRDILLQLVAGADVFVTNFQHSQLKRFELGYEDLQKLNERLIYAQVTGYGNQGPEADRRGYDTTAYWARSGLMSTIHNADAEPAKSPAGFGDHPTSMSLFGAVMLALYRRERTGLGGKVTTSLMANGAWSNSCQLQAALLGAQFVPRSTRSTAPNPLVNHYVTSDGQRFMLVCIDHQQDWPNVCRALGREELIDDGRFATLQGRVQYNAELIATLDACIAGHDMAYWKERFSEHDILWGSVPASVDVIHDPQMHVNDVFVDFEPSGTGSVKTINSPIEVHESAKAPATVAPEIGQHTEAILRELGYSAESIDQLDRDGVVQRMAVDATA
jgi:crotonobetainyl-CoA:carnitine CoA-transferase CaiB-like acyl-CoA transferase